MEGKKRNGEKNCSVLKIHMDSYGLKLLFNLSLQNKYVSI